MSLEKSIVTILPGYHIDGTTVHEKSYLLGYYSFVPSGKIPIVVLQIVGETGNFRPSTFPEDSRSFFAPLFQIAVNLDIIVAKIIAFLNLSFLFASLRAICKDNLTKVTNNC